MIFSMGCSKVNQTQPADSRGTPSPQSHETFPPAGEMPMTVMKEDPRSIKSVEGIVQEITPQLLVVHTQKNVSLKFKRDEKTAIQPAETKIAVGNRVKIEIEHLPLGMRAKTVMVQGVKQ